VGSLQSISKILDDLGKHCNLVISDSVLAEVEGLIALFITVQGCDNFASISSAVFLYLRKFFNKSVTRQVMEYFSDLFACEVQSGVEDSSPMPEWLSLMNSIRDNWDLAKGNKLFTHFSKMLGLLVTLGLCKASDVTFVVKDYKLWEPDFKVIHGNAVDVADAALQSVVFFVESISLCCKHKSLRPLLVNDRAAAEIDEEYATVVLWWDLVKNGNLKRVAGVSDSEFDRRLECLCTKLRNLLSLKTSFEKKLIQDKFMRLLKVKNDYITMKISSGVRKAPFTIELCGKSSQGKTTCADQLIDALLTSAGYPTGKEYRASYNASDKYMSTWTSDKLVLTVDDMANDKSNFVERPPTRVIIDVCNNQPYYANMADLDSKGKVFVEPAICVINTNVKNLDAFTYSNCPYSIQRRAVAVISVVAKPEFQFIVDGRPQGIDSTKVVEFYNRTGQNPTFDDLWLLTVEKAVQPDDLKTLADYKPVSYRGKPLVDAPFRLVVQYLIDEFTAHNMAQDDILERMKSRSSRVHVCGVDGCRQIQGYCDKHKMEKQFGESITEAYTSAVDMVVKRVKRDVFGLEATIEGACVVALMGAAKGFYHHWDWISCIPTPWLSNERVLQMLMYINKDSLKRRYAAWTLILWTITGAIFYGLIAIESQISSHVLFWLLLCVLGFSLTFQKYMVSVLLLDFETRLVDRNTIDPMFREFRDSHVSKICKAVGVVGVLYTISRLYKSWKSMKIQGSLEPTTKIEVEERDAEKNIWTTTSVRHLPVRTDAKSTTPTQLAGLVAKNLVYGTVTVGGKNYMVNGLFIKSNVVIIPDHYFIEDDISVLFRKENPETCGGKFTVALSKRQSVLLDGTDIRVCYACAGGSFKDLTKFLPQGRVPMHEFEMLWRSKDGDITKAYGLAEPCMTSNGAVDFRGLRYSSLTISTFKGLCGATLISRRQPLITGVHLGGQTGTTRGCSGVLEFDTIDQAIKQLRTLEGVIISGSAEHFETQVLGIKVLNDTPLHYKSPLNYMPLDSQVEYYGTCPGMTTFISEVKVTPISEHVTEVMDSPNIYGPPVQFPQYKGWQECLANLANPAQPYPCSLLDAAVKDYKKDLLPIFKSPLWNDARPLTDQENLCGIPGKKFIDAIKLDTSMGFPLNGKKRRFVTELPPTPENPNNREFDPMIMEEIKRCEDCYRKGERAYPIAKACKKDEVLSKPKCRIFYGNALPLTYLVRKYYLPILRVLQMNPLKAECAIGINCHGPEWEALHKHVLKHGKDRIIGGDYGKYDQKIPSQLLFASLRILIDFARECDYSEEDIAVMEAMTGDLVFAIVAFNGDLIGFISGTHISGNSLTAMLNGICGSLNMRCYFYANNPFTNEEDKMSFREFVALITYGDDNIGTLSKAIDNFTIKGFSEFLAGYGQIYTMPDKESELLDFLPFEDFEFLKRKTNYIPEIGVHVGALVNKSCEKMLHCFMRNKSSPLTEEHACAINVDTALREWFNHGRVEYEKRRIQLTEVAKRANISHLCTELERDFDERVQIWYENYGPS
jgi:hypothetical protein